MARTLHSTELLDKEHKYIDTICYSNLPCVYMPGSIKVAIAKLVSTKNANIPWHTGIASP